MGSLRANPQAVEPSDSDERLQLVQRIASSQRFAKAPQIRDFLVFVATRAISGRSGEINEIEIGRTVFRRGDSFNPQEDNIVRVQVRHLRSKLERYFAEEGKDEALRVTIPKRTYIPSFAPRAVVGASGATPKTPAWLRSPWTLGAALGALAVAATIAMVRLPAAQTGIRGNPVLSTVFLTGDSTKIVISDACLVILQEQLRRSVTLQEYLRPDYPGSLLAGVGDESVRSTLTKAFGRPYTDSGDFAASRKLIQFADAYHSKAAVRHPRQLNIRDFETSSVVLLGGPLAIPWYRMFEGSLNFVFDVDFVKGAVWIRNKSPRPGEKPVYMPSAQPNSEETYAVIAAMPNFRRTGHLLLLAGATADGTEAAGDMVLRDEVPADFARVLKQVDSPDQVMEILLRTRAVAGVARDSRVEAYRVSALPARP